MFSSSSKQIKISNFLKDFHVLEGLMKAKCYKFKNKDSLYWLFEKQIATNLSYYNEILSMSKLESKTPNELILNSSGTFHNCYQKYEFSTFNAYLIEFIMMGTDFPIRFKVWEISPLECRTRKFGFSEMRGMI